MADITLKFSGSSYAEVHGLVAAWLAAAMPVGVPSTGTTSAPSVSGAADRDDADAVKKVLAGVHGKASKRLLLYLAEAGLRGESVKLSAALIKEFGVTSGTAFSGMIGPVNRRAGKYMGTLLIEYPSPDPKARIWRLSPEHARIVLDFYGEAKS